MWRCRGGARRRFFPGLGAARRARAARGVPETGGCGCTVHPRASDAHGLRGCLLLPSVLQAASSSSSAPGFFCCQTSCRRADAGERRLAMPSPARRGGSSRQSTKTISSTAAALALRFALVAVAALVDAPPNPSGCATRTWIMMF